MSCARSTELVDCDTYRLLATIDNKQSAMQNLQLNNTQLHKTVQSSIQYGSADAWLQNAICALQNQQGSTNH